MKLNSIHSQRHDGEVMIIKSPGLSALRGWSGGRTITLFQLTIIWIWQHFHNNSLPTIFSPNRRSKSLLASRKNLNKKEKENTKTWSHQICWCSHPHSALIAAAPLMSGQQEPQLHYLSLQVKSIWDGRRQQRHLEITAGQRSGQPIA